MNRQLPVYFVDSQTKGKEMRTMVKLIAVIAILCMGIGEVFAEDASSYQSLFAMTKKDIFYSDQAQINGIPGIPISGSYSYAEDRAGFRVRNNPNDARIVCQKDYSDAALCSPKPSSLDFADGVRQDIRLFKIYVPAGTTNVRIGVYIPGMVPMAAAAQFGQPPLSGLSSDYYAMSANPLSLKDCITSARMVRSVDGYISVIDDSGLSSDKIYLTVPLRERWLYVKVFDFGGGYVQTIKYVVTVNYQEYLAWYKSMKPEDWKALGEEGSGPVIVSADTPLPQSSIDPFGGGGGGSATNFSVPPSPGNVPPNNPPINPPIDSGAGKPVDTAVFGGGGGQVASNVPSPGTTTPNNPFFPQQPSGQQPSVPPIFQPSGTSVFNQQMPAQKTSELAAGPIRISWTQPTMELKPVLKTGFAPANPFLPVGGGQQPDFPLGQQVKVYAAYIDSDGKVYVANSNAVFQHYQGGDIPCFTANIRSDAVMWPADSDSINPFAKLKGAVIPGRSYIFGVTPANVGSSPEDFMKHFRGTWFQLVN